MIYRVTIEQDIKYRETVIAEFSEYADAMDFIRTVLFHCEKAKANIEPFDEEEVENNDNV